MRAAFVKKTIRAPKKGKVEVWRRSVIVEAFTFDQRLLGEFLTRNNRSCIIDRTLEHLFRDSLIIHPPIGGYDLLVVLCWVDFLSIT